MFESPGESGGSEDMQSCLRKGEEVHMGGSVPANSRRDLLNQAKYFRNLLEAQLNPRCCLHRKKSESAALADR